MPTGQFQKFSFTSSETQAAPVTKPRISTHEGISATSPLRPWRAAKLAEVARG